MSDYSRLTQTDLIMHLEALQQDLQGAEQGHNETQALTQELHIHQVELEMQNRELREAQQRLEASRNRYQRLYDHAPVGYLTLNTRGCVLELNLTGAMLLGREREWLLGMTLITLLDEGEDRRLHRHLRRVFEDEGRAVTELRLKPDSGGLSRIVHLESVLDRSLEGGPQICQTVLVDITEQRRAEAQRQQQQAELVHLAHLALAGELAAGLAHELNQPLAAASVYLGILEILLKAELVDRERLYQVERLAEAQVQRAGAIIQRLKGFTRRGSLQRSWVEPLPLIENTVQFMDHRLNQGGVGLRIQCEPSLPSVWADEIQVQQVLLNLLSNALDALQEAQIGDGQLFIQVRRVAQDQMQVSVSDNGPGLSAETLGQVFESFYTTKTAGMGLGLAISRTIVEDHGGRLWATPACGRGVTFHFTLPITGFGLTPL